MRLRLCSRGKDEDEPVPRSHGQRRGGHLLRADERLCRQPARPRVGRSVFRAVVDGRQRPGRAHDDRRSRLSSDSGDTGGSLPAIATGPLSWAVKVSGTSPARLSVGVAPRPGTWPALNSATRRETSRRVPGDASRRATLGNYAGDHSRCATRSTATCLASRSNLRDSPQPDRLKLSLPSRVQWNTRVQPRPHHRGGRRPGTPARRRRCLRPAAADPPLPRRWLPGGPRRRTSVPPRLGDAVGVEHERVARSAGRPRSSWNSGRSRTPSSDPGRPTADGAAAAPDEQRQRVAAEARPSRSSPPSSAQPHERDGAEPVGVVAEQDLVERVEHLGGPAAAARAARGSCSGRAAVTTAASTPLPHTSPTATTQSPAPISKTS